MARSWALEDGGLLRALEEFLGSEAARRSSAVALALGMAWTSWASAPAAATLDAAADGDDLVFTWDGGTDDLLSGTDPADLQVVASGVSPPWRMSGANVLGVPSAYFRLASGSNMAWRIQRTFGDLAVGRLVAHPVTLPGRTAYATSFALLAAWPTLTEIMWRDTPAERFRSAVRAAGLITGDDSPLPCHGGVWLTFATAEETVAMVGSEDPSCPAITAADLALYPPPCSQDACTDGWVLPIPPHARLERVIEILCGRAGVDWPDADGDFEPDDGLCGTDLDADGFPDTGLWRSAGDPGARLTISKRSELGDEVVGVWPMFPLGLMFRGTWVTLRPGSGYFLQFLGGGYSEDPGALNLPYGAPTW